MSLVTDDPKLKRQFLEETLAIDMGHAEARRQLAILDGRLNPAEIVNPEAPATPGAGMQAVSADRFICPNCGARMVFTPDGASLVCENCMRAQKISSAAPVTDRDFFVGMADGSGFKKTISVKTFDCQGCGAVFLLAPSELSTTCAYCGSVYVIGTEKIRDLVEPDAVVPMAVSQGEAVTALTQWMKKNQIEPQGRVEAGRGLYLPTWVFDLIGNIPWSGKVIRNKREVPVSGESPATTNDVCVPGSTKLEKLSTELLPGYSLSAVPAYDPRYLSGWSAQVYEVAMAEAALEARRICVDKTRLEILAVQGNVHDLRYSTSAISITAYRLILLPVWVTEYSLKGRLHRVAINGQTGQVHGDLPGHGLKKILSTLMGS